MKAWTKTDSKTGRFIRQYEHILTICQCGKEFEASKARIKDGRDKFCSKKCMYLYRSPKKVKPNAGYSAIHKWVATKFGQPMECEWCAYKSDNKYQIQWANLSGEYTRDREDWARLCAKCHYRYDRVDKYVTT